jgi:hypothetical protein
METIEKLNKTILKEYPRLGLEDRFSFNCHKGVSCFNKCCSDVNIFLTPYDIVRLKNRLGIKSSEFLEKYTLLPIQEDMRHPVVMLRMSDEELKCPFVSEEGCTVYEDRPWSCRMYPLGVASPKEAEQNNNEEFYFLLKETVCQGFKENREWSVLEWMDDQSVSEYNELGDSFREISLHDYFIKAKAIEPVKLEMFYTVCYDIDKFREFVFNSTFLKRFRVDIERVEKMRENDLDLLRFGFEWLKFSLFGEKTITVNEGYLKPVA